MSMSGMLPTDDQEFSFSLPLTDEREVFSSQRLPQTPRVFIVAIVASLAIHLGIFQWYVPALAPEEHSNLAKSIQITLDYALPAAPIEQLGDEPMVDTATERQLAAPSEPEVVDAVIVEPKDLPQQANWQDFKTVVGQQNRYRDDYLPPANSETTLTTSREPAVDDQPFNNVFDSRLRTRLQSGSVSTANTRPAGPKTFINTHGETVVELDNGLCMKAALAAIGQPTNWYMTACAGRKTESEQMMERVNNEVKNGKLMR